MEERTAIRRLSLSVGLTSWLEDDEHMLKLLVWSLWHWVMLVCVAARKQTSLGYLMNVWSKATERGEVSHSLSTRRERNNLV